MATRRQGPGVITIPGQGIIVAGMYVIRTSFSRLQQ
jgi:hypothetical protein